MNKEKFFLGVYMVLFAAGAITIQVLSMASSAVVYIQGASPRLVVIQRPSSLAVLEQNSSLCTPEALGADLRVGGLQGVDIPRLPEALRLNYSDNNTSQYSLRASEREVFNYYLPELASQCWQISSIEPQKITWKKDDKTFEIAVYENSLGEKTLVDYRMYGAGVVLGETYKAAQTTCPEGQYWCSGTASCKPTSDTNCAPSGGTTTGTNCPAPPTCQGGSWVVYDSNGCPSGCSVPETTGGTSGTPTCSGTYSQNGSYSCNYSLCPSGCSYDSQGCPSGCYTQATCTGEFQQSGSSYPSCNYSRCPNGCTWDSSGCPNECSSGSGSISSCGSGYYWCSATGSCKPVSDTNCAPSGGSTSPGSCSGDQIWCASSSGGMGWCQMPPCPTTSGSGSFSGDANACPGFSYSRWDSQGRRYCQLNNEMRCDYNYPSYLTNGANYKSENCPAGSTGGSYIMPSNSSWVQHAWTFSDGSESSYILNRTDSEYTIFISSIDQQCRQISKSRFAWKPNAGSDAPSNWQNFGIPDCSGTATGGSGSMVSCPSGQYMCNNACIASGATCNSYAYYQPGSSTPTQCPSGQYYCPSVNSCISNSSSCNTTATQGQMPLAPTVSCGQCQVASNGQCVRAPVGTPDSRCGSGGVCDKNGGCIILKSGQTVVGNGAICGNGWCDEKVGENNVNCPKECSNAPQPTPTPANTPANLQNQPTPPGSPNSGLFPGQGQNGFQGQPGQFPGGPGGPSEEEIQKMDQQRFEQMKKGLNQFTRGVAQMQKMITSQEKRLNQMGVSVPAELKAALAAAPAIVEKIKNAKTPEELDDIIADVQDVGMAMQEWGPRFGDLMRLGNMMKQMDRDLKKLQSSVKRAQGYVKSNATLGDFVNELSELYNSMLEASKSIKEFAKTDPESALDILEEDFYGRMEEFWNKVSLIGMLRNLKTGLNQAARDIRLYESTVKKLVAKKVDKETIDDLKQFIADMKEKVAEIKALSLQKDVDPEDIKMVGEDLWQSMSDFENIVSDLGMGYYAPKVQAGQGVSFQAPEGFLGNSNIDMNNPGIGQGGPEAGIGGFGAPSAGQTQNSGSGGF